MSVNVDLDQLKHFVAVGEELHFTRAAQNRLHVSQPWLSRSVRSLEQKLGVQLFQRHSRHVELTDSGRRLLYGARKLIYDFERTVSTVVRDRKGNNQLTVGYSSYVDLRFMAELKQMTLAGGRHPASFESSSSEETVAHVRNREWDCGIIIFPSEISNLDSILLFRLPLAAAMQKTHPLARKRSLRLEDFKEERLIVSGKQQEVRFREWLLSRFAEVGTTPKIAQEAASPHEAQYLVTRGLGIALGNLGAFRTSPGGVVVRPFHLHALEIETVLVCRKEKPSAGLGAFLNGLRQMSRIHLNDRRIVAA